MSQFAFLQREWPAVLDGLFSSGQVDELVKTLEVVRKRAMAA